MNADAKTCDESNDISRAKSEPEMSNRHAIQDTFAAKHANKIEMPKHMRED